MVTAHPEIGRFSPSQAHLSPAFLNWSSFYAQQIELPMFKTVMDKIGKPIVFNIAVLGAVLSLTDLLRPESIMSVLETKMPVELLGMNREALDLGMEMGKEFKS